MLSFNETCWVDHKDHILWCKKDKHITKLNVFNLEASWQESQPLTSVDVAVDIADVLTSVSPYAVIVIDVEGSVTVLACSPRNEWRVISSELTIASEESCVVKQGCLLHNHVLYWQEYNSSELSAVNIYQVTVGYPDEDRFTIGNRRLILDDFPECRAIRAGETIIFYPKSTEFKFFVTLDGSQFHVYGVHLRCLYSRAVSTDQPLVYSEVSLLISGMMICNDASFVSSVADPSMKSLLLVDSSNRLLCFRNEDFTVMYQLPNKLGSFHPVIQNDGFYTVTEEKDTLLVRTLGISEGSVQTFPVDGKFLRWNISVISGLLLGYISNTGVFSLPETECSALSTSDTTEPLTLAKLKREMSLYVEELGQRSEIVEALDFTPVSLLSGTSKLTTSVQNVIAKHKEIHSSQHSLPRTFAVQPQQIISKLETVEKDSLSKTFGFLNYHAESSPQLVFNALTVYLMTKNMEDRHAHWKRLLTMSKEKMFPLLNIYLHLVWKIQPGDLIDTVLMAGSMIQDLTHSETKNVRIIVHLLDLMLPAFLTFRNEKSRVLVISKLLVLCGNVDHVLRGFKLLVQANEFDIAISMLSDIDDSHTKSVSITIFEQHLGKIDDVERRNQLRSKLQNVTDRGAEK